MSSSQDRDGPNGQPTTSKPDDRSHDPPATPTPTPAPASKPTPSSLTQPHTPPAPSLLNTHPPASPTEQEREQEQDQKQEPVSQNTDKNAPENINTPSTPQKPSDSHLVTTTNPTAVHENGTPANGPVPTTDHNLTPITTQPNAIPFGNPIYNWLATQMPQLDGLPMDLNNSLFLSQPSIPWAVSQPDMSLLPPDYGAVGDIASDDHDDDDDDSYVPDVKTYGHLEFEDSTFWITTRNILIGRDQAAYTQAKKQRDRERTLGLNPGTTLHSPNNPPARYQAYTKSYISEEGGLLGPESDGDGDGNTRPAKRRKANAAGQFKSQVKQKQEAQGHSHVISSRQYIDHTPGAALVDVDSLRPSDDFVARVRIHGQAPEVVENTKGISRDHAKIQYNSCTKVWEIAILGRNGLFHNDVHHDKGAIITLRSGDTLQIQSVCFKFFLTGVARGMTGAEEDSLSDAPISKTYSQGGKEMSFDFQSRDRGDKDTSGSSVVSGDEPMIVDFTSNQSDVSDKEMDDVSDLQTPDHDDDLDGDANSTIRQTVELDNLDDESLKKSPSADDTGQLGQLPMPPKKRGPGRPPKNGVMSKREERLLRKLAQEEAKKNMPPQEPGEQPQKRKVGRPRKHPRPDEEGDSPEKRKYNKSKKPKGEGEDDDADGEKPSKEKSQKAKTPPLELRREDYTEEQLQKPTKNYQLLIDEIMVGAPPNGYSLKQIYKRIQKRWPYFYFNVDTKGWESSVRHNLLGSDCFKKIDGHWHRVPGVPLESGKKQRKPSPIASPRPAGLYSGGYGHHPYQPSGHPQHPGHQPIAHNTGLSQPNLPPRYPPNGQAYQIAQGPPHRPGQPGVPPGQQPPARTGFPQPQAATAAPHAHGYANTNASSRPQYPAANQTQPFNPAYGNRPPPPPGSAPGAARPGAAQIPVQNAAQRLPHARPGQAPGPISQHGYQAAQAHSQPSAQRATPTQHQQPSVPNSAPQAPLGPVIDPILRDFIKDFKNEVIKQLQAREGRRSEAVAMSVINRGLGITDRSLVPECEQYEQLILDIFHQHNATFPSVLASKRRAQEASRAACTAPARSAPAAAAPSNPNRSATGPPGRMNGALAVSTIPATKTTSGAAESNTSTAIVTSRPTNPPPATVGAMTKEDLKTSGTSIIGTVESAAAKPVAAAIAPSTNAAVATKPSVPARIASAPSTNVPAATTSSAPVTTNPTSVAQPAKVADSPKPSNSPALGVPAAAVPSLPKASDSLTPSSPATAVSNPPKASNSPAPSGPKNTESSAPHAVTANPAPITLAVTTPAGQKPATGSSTPIATPNSRGGGLTSTSTNNTVAGSRTVPPKPATANAATPNTPAPAAASSLISKPAATTATPSAPTATTPAPTPKPTVVATVPNASASTAPRVPAAGQSATLTSTAASSSPAPATNGVRAASTPSASTPTSGLLDPKLVTVILNFKTFILPTLVGRLGLLLGESLVMSAVDRMLGFTDDTFILAKDEQQKQHLQEAEKTLMTHLETRFKDYVKNRATSK